MAEFKEVDDKTVQRMKEAVTDRDGGAASRLLEEVGSCGWSSLVKQANKHADLIIVGATELDSDNETINLQRMSNVTGSPFAKVKDIRCERK